MLTTTESEFGSCQDHLDRFLGAYPESNLSQRAAKTVRLLAATDELSQGRPAAWAGGIIYFVATHGRQPCGVPGLLNAEIEVFFGVSMGTIRRRAAQIDRLLAI